MDPFLRRPPARAVGVRGAAPGDAGEIARVQRVTWTVAYRDLLPAAVLEAWDDDGTARAWTAAIATPPSGAHRVLVAVDGGTVVGFAAVAPAEEVAATGELVTLVVEPRWGRRGHGSRLLAAAADGAREAGVRRLIMWVPEVDQVTARFLGSAGWALDGSARSLDAGTATIRQLRWHTLLDDDRAAAENEGAP